MHHEKIFYFPNNSPFFPLKKFSDIFSKIKKYYPETIQGEKIIFSSIRGLLKSLDPHSYFLDPSALRSMDEDQRGNYYGIGIRISKYEDRLTVVAPLKGTPAYSLGIRAGDIIVEIDGEETRPMSLDSAMRKLRGTKGTLVNIKIKRENISRLFEYKIKRAEIPLNSITYSLPHPLNPLIGYISIRTFGNTTARELKNNIEKLIKDHHIKGLILDLRGNSGGSLYAAIDISDLFLEKGKTIVSIRSRRKNKIFKAQDKIRYQIPLAILINRSSASASEIVAAALQFHKKASIIGSRSWGKGLVETLYKLPLNSAIALTTAKYYTPDNKCIQRDFSKLDNYYSSVLEKGYDTDKTIEGGVFPDYLVKSRIYPTIVITLISKGIIFEFSRKIIKNAPNLRKNFKASQKILNQFARYLSENKIKYNPKDFKKHIEDIKYEIEREVITNKFSSDEGTRVFLKSDPVTQKSVDILNPIIKREKNNGK